MTLNISLIPLKLFLFTFVEILLTYIEHEIFNNFTYGDDNR